MPILRNTRRTSYLPSEVLLCLKPPSTRVSKRKRYPPKSSEWYPAWCVNYTLKRVFKKKKKGQRKSPFTSCSLNAPPSSPSANPGSRCQDRPSDSMASHGRAGGRHKLSSRQLQEILTNLPEAVLDSTRHHFSSEQPLRSLWM